MDSSLKPTLIRISKITSVLIGVALSIIFLLKGFDILQMVFTKASDSNPHNVAVSKVSSGGAKVEWLTDQETEAIIEYGTSSAKMDLFVPEKKQTKNHVIDFGGDDTNGIRLLPDTVYYFHIRIGDKIYDNKGVPWTFTTKSKTDDKNQAFIRPTQSINVDYIQPTAKTEPLPTLAAFVCGSTDCLAICQKIGKTCSSQDWFKSGCIGKVNLSGCTQIKPTLVASSKSRPTAVPTKVPTSAPTPTAVPVPTLKVPSDIERLQPYTSANYKLYTDSDKQKAESYLEFFEGFKKYFSANFFNNTDIPVVSVYLFSKPDDFMRYRTMDSVYGYYTYRERKLVTHAEGGLGTFAHELTHSFMFERMPTSPEWMVEGLPTFFEKLIGYYDSGQGMKLVVGFQNPWRVKEFTDGLYTGATEKHTLLSVARHQASKAEERFLAVYLYQRGWYKTYINKLLQTPSTDPNADLIVAASGKSLSQLEEDWSAWVDQMINDAESPQSTLNVIPLSFVSPNKTEWDAWLNVHRSELQRLGVDFSI